MNKDTTYKKLMGMGGIDMNTNIEKEVKGLKKYQRNYKIASVILTMLITLADITVRTIIITIVVVKTLQYLGVL